MEHRIKNWSISGDAITALSLLFCIIIYFYLPEIIPTHRNMEGQIDGRGPKHTLLIVAAIHLVVYALIRWVSDKPQYHNYIVKVTEQNKEALFNASRLLGKQISCLLSILFGIVYISMYYAEAAWAANLVKFGTGITMASMMYLVVRNLMSAKG